LQGNFGSGEKSVTVNFLNDSYGGSSAADRNVYVESIASDGTTIHPNAGLYNNGAQSFVVPVGATVSGGTLFGLFDLTSGNFGDDIIGGFDPSADILKIGTGQAASYAAIQADLSSSGGNAVITLDSTHSITLQGVAPGSLSAANFAFG